MAVGNFSSRGYAKLGGFILNKRNVKNEIPKVEELAADFNSSIIGVLEWSALVQESEEIQRALLANFPDSPDADAYRVLAGNILKQLEYEK
jgi:nitrogenase iron protein NifH